MISIRTIDKLPLKSGSRVFYRVDYNVPLEGTKITDATRIEETVPTIKLLRERGAALVIASHLGRPKGKRDPKFSLKPVRPQLSTLVGDEVQWADDCIGPDVEEKASKLGPGGILLVENLRFHDGEEKNDRAFAEELKKLADFYVNDAFGASHRAHASIDALPRLYSKKNIAGGLLMAKELEFLQRVTHVSDRPFVALLGGAKIAGKIEPLEALVKTADVVLIGGGMANTFLAADGVNMGRSLVDHESMGVARRIASSGSRAQMILPLDLVVADSLDNPTETRTVDVSVGVGAEEMALDIGPKTIQRFTGEVKTARTVFWNGPMGVFEQEQFARGTMAMARAVAEAKATTIVGGGESVEAVKKSGFAEKITHISTGGGASLEFISGAKLPGVEVLRK